MNWLLMPAAYALCAIPPLVILVKRSVSAESRIAPVRHHGAIVGGCLLAGVALLYLSGQLPPSGFAAYASFSASAGSSSEQRPDVIGDTDYYGPNWTGVRRETALDRVFLANARGREELDVTLQKVAIDAQLAWRCRLRSDQWLAGVQQKLHDIANDQATHLNDPLTMPEVAGARVWRIDHATDSFPATPISERRVTCAAIRQAHGLRDADEIGRRQARSPARTAGLSDGRSG